MCHEGVLILGNRETDRGVTYRMLVLSKQNDTHPDAVNFEDWLSGD